MAEDSLEELVEKASKQLGLLITKPKLTSNLLSKPPFRYLHDLIIAVNRSTGFLNHLFADDETFLDSATCKDKSRKVDFLTRVISVTEIALRISGQKDVKVLASPSKIVAGLEPNQTNRWLIQLSLCAMMVKDGLIQNDTIMNTYHQEFKTGITLHPNEQVPISPVIAQSTLIKNDSKSRKNSIEIDQFQSQRKEQGEHKRLDISRKSSLSGDASIRETTMENGDYVKLTQDIVGSIINRPRLTPELLNRPPFRFLQDIFRKLNQVSGLFRGIFTDKQLEQKFENANAKIEFLNCIISHARLQQQVNAKKIVSGQQPERTNLLLQTLGRMAQNMKQNGDQPIVPQSSSESNQSMDQPTIVKNENREILNSNAKLETVVIPMVDIPKNQISCADRSSIERPKTARRAPPKIDSNVVNHIDENLNEKIPSRAVILDNELIGQHNDDDDDDGIEETLEAEYEGTLGYEYGDAIVDDGVGGGDQSQHGKLVRDIINEQIRAQEDAVAEQHNSLMIGVNSINESPGTGGKSGGGIVMGRIGGRRSSGSNISSNTLELNGQFSGEQIELLRTTIQRICQSVNPLGKCIDYMSDDLDYMKKERERWKREQGRQSERLARELSTSSDALKSLQSELDQITFNIVAKQTQVAQFKSEILRNDRRIARLLESQTRRGG